MECPKCRYVRNDEETVPEWQCPNCGIAYQKFSTGRSGQTPVPPSQPKSNSYSFTKPRSNLFRNIRISILLVILFVVSMDSWLTVVRTTDWNSPLWVVVYPINADGRGETANYIRSLNVDAFRSIESFMVSEAQRYKLSIGDPLDIKFGPEVREMPPLPPTDRSILKTMLWSLNLRYWSLVVDEYDGPEPDIRVFVLYQRYQENVLLPHSTGLQKGMVSVVHAFASDRVAERNNVVIAHEVLHTLGATDKYDLSSGNPIYPEGYGEPLLKPLWPQRWAEIMGGRIAISDIEAEMPKSLKQALIGPKTAREIGWLE